MKSLEKLKKRASAKDKLDNVVVNDRQDFEYEFSFIRNDYFNKFARFCIANAPEIFLTYGASKNGDFHPRCSNEIYGLTRHTKYCMRLARQLFANEYLYPFNEFEQDLVYVALLIHDFGKFGIGKYKNFIKHGSIAVHYIEDCVKGTEFENFVETEAWHIIAGAVKKHLGQFGGDINGYPTNKIEIFVAKVDYITSLKVQDEIEDIKKLEINKKDD